MVVKRVQLKSLGKGFVECGICESKIYDNADVKDRLRIVNWHVDNTTKPWLEKMYPHFSLAHDFTKVTRGGTCCLYDSLTMKRDFECNKLQPPKHSVLKQYCWEEGERRILELSLPEDVGRCATYQQGLIDKGLINPKEKIDTFDVQETERFTLKDLHGTNVIEYYPSFIPKEVGDEYVEVMQEILKDNTFKKVTLSPSRGTRCVHIGYTQTPMSKGKLIETLGWKLLRKSRHHERFEKVIVKITSRINEYLRIMDPDFYIYWTTVVKKRLDVEFPYGLCAPDMFLSCESTKSHIDVGDDNNYKTLLLVFKSSDCEGGDIVYDDIRAKVLTGHCSMSSAFFGKHKHSNKPILHGSRFSIVVPNNAKKLSYDSANFYTEPLVSSGKLILENYKFFYAGRYPPNWKESMLPELLKRGAVGMAVSEGVRANPEDIFPTRFMIMSQDTLDKGMTVAIRTGISNEIPLVGLDFMNDILAFEKAPTEKEIEALIKKHMLSCENLIEQFSKELENYKNQERSRKQRDSDEIESEDDNNEASSENHKRKNSRIAGSDEKKKVICNNDSSDSNSSDDGATYQKVIGRSKIQRACKRVKIVEEIVDNNVGNDNIIFIDDDSDE